MSSSPFWFVNLDLLADFFLAEVNTVARLLANHAGLRTSFDSPEVTDAQRRICFELLAHRVVASDLSEAIASHWVPGPTLSDSERSTLAETGSLVPNDGPSWARELGLVADEMPRHIAAALPEPLRTVGWGGNQQRLEDLRAAAQEFSALEPLRALVQRTIDTQIHRLMKRWSAPVLQDTKTAKQPKHWQKGLKGLTRKADLSQYKQGLTEKQEMAFSLKYEYQVGPVEIAARMGIDRATAYEHIEAANRKVQHLKSAENHRSNRAKTNLDS